MRLPLFGLLRRKSKSASHPATTTRPKLECLEGRIAPATLTVGSTAPYKTITAALAAANPGDTINVNAGTYNEAITITKANVNLTAKGAVTIQPDASKVVPVTINGNTGGDAVIDVWAAGVKVNGFVVDGSQGGSSSNLWAGIRVLNGGSATISNNTVVNFISAPAFVNLGIQVGSSYFASSGSATISNNSINNYAGAGVLVDSVGSTASISNNAITGRGTANLLGGQLVTEYGVQVSRGALATVTNNAISSNTTSGPASGHNSPLSAGIYFFQAGVSASYTNNTVYNNAVTGNDDGILIQQTNGIATAYVQVKNNNVSSNYGYAGIDVLSSNYTRVENNSVNNNLTFNGIALTTSQFVNVLNNNVSRNGNAASATDGIYDFGGTSNSFTGNTVYGNTGNGISLEASTQETVSSNTFNSGSTHNAGYGIKLTGTTNSTGTGNKYGGSTRQIQRDQTSTGDNINGIVVTV